MSRMIDVLIAENRVCSRCGRSIPLRRLAVLPETTRCVECSAERAHTVLDIEVDGPEIEDLVRSAQAGRERGD